MSSAFPAPPGPQPWSAEDLAANARAPATIRAYGADMRDFTRWCAEQGEISLPAAPETVGRYIAARASDLKPTTLARRLAAIVVAHRQANLPFDRHHPAVADVLAGARRILGTAPVQKLALTTEDVRAMVMATSRTPIGLRDRAVILTTFAAALRRSEAAALMVRDVCYSPEGMTLIIRRSKADQDAKGELRAIPRGGDPDTCPVRAMQAWVMAARLDGGPLFRRCDRKGRVLADGISGETVAEVVKRAVRRVGEQEGWSRRTIAERIAQIGAHSLRAGLCTAAAAHCDEHAIRRQSGHKSHALRRYIREGTLFVNNAAAKVGL